MSIASDSNSQTPLSKTTSGSDQLQESVPETAFKHHISRPPGVDTQSRIMWEYVIGIAVFHAMILLLFVPHVGSYLFSWWGLLWLPVGNFLFCSMGIGAGLHRLHTHRSFKCPLWFEHVLAILGVCCLQDTPVRWVVVHRLHHQFSDHEPDPHTPMVTWFWGHVGWLFIENRQVTSAETYDRYAKDLLRDPFYMKMERSFLYIWINVAQLMLFYLVGFAIGFLLTHNLWDSTRISVQWAYWGVFMRIVYTWNVTWAVNSISHMYGYRNYETRENSRNNWLVALATSGEGWHNNHHVDPRSCAHGHRWWEVDLTYTTICLLGKLGLAWDIVPPTQSLLERRAKNAVAGKGA